MTFVQSPSILIGERIHPPWIDKADIFILFFSIVVLLTQLKRLKVWWYQLAPRIENRSTNGRGAIPQLPSLPIVGSLYRAFLPGVDVFQVTMGWALKYGKIFKARFGSEDFYVINDPAMLQKILSSTNPHHLNKHQLVYKTIFSGCIQNGIIVSEYDAWNPHRRIISRSFRYNSLQHQIDIVNLHAKDLVGIDLPAAIKQCEVDGKSLNVIEIMHFSTIKSILNTLLGSDLFSDEERDLFQHNFQAAKAIVTQRLMRPWLLIKPIWKLHPLSRELTRLERCGEDFIQTVMDRFRKRQGEATTEDNDIGGSRRFKCMMEEMLDAGMSDREVLDESLSILIAGHETTSWSLSFLLLHLALHPVHQEKCRKEVDEVFQSKIEKSSLDLDLSMDDLSSLKYLERCVHENLRLLPIIPVLQRRLDMPIKIDDEIELEAGTTAFISPWTFHRLPDLWPDPERFDPDRFLPENVKNRHPYAYLPFSAGPRNCIGWKSAIMTIKMMAAWILRHYELSTNDKWEDIKLKYSITIATEKDISLTLKRRTSCSEIKDR